MTSPQSIKEPVRNLLNYFHARVELGQEATYRVDMRTELRTFVLPITPYDLFDNEEDVRWRSAWFLFHEMGHLVVAAVSRRNRPDYGIPSGTIGDPYWDHEDSRASLIEFELCRHVGLKTRMPQEKLIAEDCRSERLREWFAGTGQAMAQEVYDRANDPHNVHMADWKIARSNERLLTSGGCSLITTTRKRSQ